MKVMFLGFLLKSFSAMLTKKSKPPEPCKIEAQVMTAVMMSSTLTGGAPGCIPKPNTKTPKPIPPAAPRPAPPHFAPMKMAIMTTASSIQNIMSIVVLL